MVKLRTASGIEFFVNPRYVVSVWPTFDDGEARIVLFDGSQTEVKGTPVEVSLKLAAS